MGKEVKRGDSVKERLAATRLAWSFLAPWVAFVQWIALMLPFSQGYSLPGVSSKHASIYPHRAKIDVNASSTSYFTLLGENIEPISFTESPQHDRNYVEGLDRKTTGSAGAHGSFLSAGAGESLAIRNGALGKQTPNTVTSVTLPRLRDMDARKADTEKPRSQVLAIDREKRRNTHFNSFSQAVASSRKGQTPRAFSAFLGGASTQERVLRHDTDVHGGVTVRPKEGGREDSDGPAATCLSQHDVEKQKDPLAASFLNSGVRIVDELVATALSASSAILAPPTAGGIPAYAAVGQMQPPLTPAQAPFSMHLSPPLQQDADEAEQLETVFIALGCAVAVALIVLLAVLLSGQRKRR